MKPDMQEIWVYLARDCLYWLSAGDGGDSGRHSLKHLTSIESREPLRHTCHSPSLSQSAHNEGWTIHILFRLTSWDYCYESGVSPSVLSCLFRVCCSGPWPCWRSVWPVARREAPRGPWGTEEGREEGPSEEAEDGTLRTSGTVGGVWSSKDNKTFCPVSTILQHYDYSKPRPCVGLCFIMKLRGGPKPVYPKHPPEEREACVGMCHRSSSQSLPSHEGHFRDKEEGVTRRRWRQVRKTKRKPCVGMCHRNKQKKRRLEHEERKRRLEHEEMKMKMNMGMKMKGLNSKKKKGQWNREDFYFYWRYKVDNRSDWKLTHYKATW